MFDQVDGLNVGDGGRRVHGDFGTASPTCVKSDQVLGALTACLLSSLFASSLGFHEKRDDEGWMIRVKPSRVEEGLESLMYTGVWRIQQT